MANAAMKTYEAIKQDGTQKNQIENMQTRIDYQDVTIDFHDDNLGLTRGLLEDYYMYYYVYYMLFVP